MNISDRFWKSATVVAYVLVALLAVLIVKEGREIGYVGSNPNMTSTITVDGTGEATASAQDIVANFSFTVTENAKTVAAAQTAATTKTNAALKALKDAGIADTDVTTEGYSIAPHYEYQNTLCQKSDPTSSAVVYCPPSRSVITGYDVSQTVSVKVRDLSKAGSLLSTIGGLGVQNLNGLTFTVDKPDALQDAARSQAIEKAQGKAQALAQQLGVRLVRVTSFTEYNNQPRPIYFAATMGKGGADSAVAPTPDIPTGEQKVTSNVSITYEIQ